MSAAKPTQEQSAHWYTKDGQSAHDADLRRARKEGLLPSVTTIEKDVRQYAWNLVAWMVEQNVTACVTHPGLADALKNGTLDEFVAKVMDEEGSKQQAAKAADKGTRIHDCIEKFLIGVPFKPDSDISTEVGATIKLLVSLSLSIRDSEKNFICDLYAGKVDCVARDAAGIIHVIDFKSTKTQAKYKKLTAWDNWKDQLGAYCYMVEKTLPRDKFDPPQIKAANIVISTSEPGRVEYVPHEDWRLGAERFNLLANYWCLLKNYDPRKVLSVDEQLNKSGL